MPSSLWFAYASLRLFLLTHPCIGRCCAMLLPTACLWVSCMTQRGKAVCRCLRRALLTSHAEDQAVVRLDTQGAGAGGCPLWLVRVHVDAGAVLVVIPAAGQLLATDAHAGVATLSQASHYLAGACHAAITAALLLLHHDDARRAYISTGGQLGGAVGTDTLLEEAGILAGTRHTELHGALVGPLLLLARHLGANHSCDICSVTQCLCLLARGTRLGRLRGVVAHVLKEPDVPKGEAVTVLQPADTGSSRGGAVPLQLDGTALATRDPAGRRLRGHEPRAVAALPRHHVAAVAHVVATVAQTRHVWAALATGASVVVNFILGGPNPHCDSIIPYGGHFVRRVERFFCLMYGIRLGGIYHLGQSQFNFIWGALRWAGILKN